MIALHYYPKQHKFTQSIKTFDTIYQVSRDLQKLKESFHFLILIQLLQKSKILSPTSHPYQPTDVNQYAIGINSSHYIKKPKISVHQLRLWSGI